ncbi:hypothetical protein [Geodermatophilus marinus]|uniref:hypothetical protein n=1 Tax=Geodermatophilus sp. LHW52908 TaxID=2303986 RepID=UPI000E3B7D19|nr:hypothetical protein [Geodermatophilus sp. LHW52908]RFU21242.1 hypothetical protein D0Z06_11955 [Geodermatophilus sp. LHW52908]
MRSREQRWQDRLALPVLVAALASVPAMFLSIAEGVWGTAGRVVDVASGVVLVAETVVLFAVTGDRRAWIRGHLGLIGMTLLVVLAVVFALGPVQVLRLARTVGALRVLRAGRIVKAARAVRQRTGWTGPFSHVFAVAAGLLVAVFVGVVLADPTSQTRLLLERWVDLGIPAVVVLSVVAGLLLGGATWLLARDPGSGPDAGED